jgi:hypothetical protein
VEEMYGVGSDFYGDFGAIGFWRYDGTWTKLSPSNAEGMIEEAGDLYVDFGGVGFWRYDGEWTKLSPSNVEGVVAAGGELYAEVGSVGFWRYDGSWVRLSRSNAEGVFEFGGEAYADLGASGLHRAVRGLLWNDSDVEGSSLSAAVVSNASHGSVVMQPDGSFTYTPEAGFVGTDSFTYRVSDGELESAAATVSIVVNAAGANLVASGAAEGGLDESPLLTVAQLDAITAEAVDRWSEGLNLDIRAQGMLSRVSFEIVDFSDLTLGRALEGSILIDADGAGYGWYIDETPADDLEFGLKLSDLELTAAEASPAFGRMDLLTVVMHELGHVLGFEDLDPSAGVLMSGTLDSGIRRLPGRDGLEDAGLVRMDTGEEAGVMEIPLVKALQSNRSSWLDDFLLYGAKGQYNPFDPTGKIKISIPGNHGREVKKKMH